MFVVAAFYHFFDFPDYAEKRGLLQELLKKHAIKGSLLIAAEGINGTLAGSREAMDALLSYLKENIVHKEFTHKESLCDYQPFGRAKVRLKKELISLGPHVSPTYVGTYVSPKDWNALISDPDTIVLDTRNAYETHVGTFDRAIDPRIKSFKQLPAFVRKTFAEDKQKKIATFCTGGIRCEKLTAWMREEGFKEVYHLEGGILKYLEEVPAAESKWQGECYVFDERVAVGHGLAPSETVTMCLACGHALTLEDREHPCYIENKICSHCKIKPG